MNVVNENKVDLNKEIYSYLKRNNLEKYIHDIKNIDLKYCLELEIFRYTKNKIFELKDYILCYDEEFNPYLFVEFNPTGSILLSLLNYEAVLINPISKTKLINSLDKNKTYKVNLLDFEITETNGEIHEININNERTKKLLENKISIVDNLKDENLINYLNRVKIYSKVKSRSIWKTVDSKYSCDPEQYLLNADVEVPHSWWFKTAKYDFGYVSDPSGIGYCQYIGLAMLL
ncbi:hypothetical protein [[Mycoplasma] anseris]|uniref:Uncharacterized protein n=1 Tax=[Mycoplasma] anseris TaxID=92400 RepID=A0A2Z4NCR3_9BACT|nr:hypothetical protein [[Mycoplasma] anseris]AWX69358.1 hypothetical protein DP065_01130 [[Mycoplasma] anseris]